MWSAFTEIDEALIALGNPGDEFKQLPSSKAVATLRALKERYLGGKNPTWWWEHYQDAVSWNPPAAGYSLLPRLCPDDTVLFIPHEENEERVYVSSPSLIANVLGKCAAFEYTVAGKDLDWLLTETHHDSLIAVGNRAKELLVKAQNA